jgi:CubicO group peptidase (beta-lactamase class C family)
MRAAALLLALGPAAPVAAQVATPAPPAASAGDAARFAPGWSGSPACCEALVAELRALLRDSMARAGIPGVQVAVMRDGRLVWSEGIGFADLEQGVGVSTGTRFRAGSVSKSLTSAAIGLLVERGRLDLDAEVQRYVPGFPRKRWPVTVRQLAGHLAGIRHYRGDEFASRARYADVRSGLAVFQDDSLLVEPGTR